MKWSELAEDVILLRTTRGVAIARELEKDRPFFINDVVASPEELAIQYQPGYQQEVRKLLDGELWGEPISDLPVMEIPVCYDLGIDWKEVCDETGLNRETIIQIHTERTYHSQYGFMPGFLYLHPLDERLQCSRKAQPRTHLPAGSVGIGGSNTGIYALSSPGGWQIIGLTPLTLFDAAADDPFTVQWAQPIRFYAISKAEYDGWH